MTPARVTLIASILAIGSGMLWGFYWIPVRALGQAGLGGAWGTFAITMAACLLIFPFAARQLHRINACPALGIAATALGGVAFTLYSVAFLYGQVTITVLLFFLTPVWSTIIGRYIFGWPTPALRIWAIIVGLTGLAIMLSADGTWPIPRNLGEWMGLLSGILWSLASTGIRVKSNMAPAVAALIFATGACSAACVLALWLGPAPQVTHIWTSLVIVIGTGGLWWAAAMIALMWATLRLDPARIGILLMSEVIVGAGSAALLAGEYLSPLEMLGGGLVIGAGLLELWPVRAVPNAGRP
ncbi:DMT family transporter [Yoonia sp. BS5-3]|uniref:DMT family transporter n=1 Tax=Yoonia phaeophyticola TaxID=3137369 RepID=A0ABZ2V3K6_9RHOB